MKYEIKEIPESKRRIEAELTGEEFDVYYAEALREISSGMEMPGFRKGHVPIKMVEEKISSNDLLSEAAEHAIRHTWINILKESNIEAVSQPKVEIVKVAKGNPFVFALEVEVLPEIKLPDIRDIAKGVKKQEEAKIEDKEIEQTLNWLRETRAKHSVKNGAIEKGDLVEIDFFSPDLAGDKNKKDRFIVNKGHYIKGMDEALIGMKTGEEKDFETENPQDKKLKIRIHVKINSISVVELPEITDEWAKTLGDFKDLNALKQDIKKGIKEEKEVALKQNRREEVLSRILEKIKADIPQSMIKRETEALLDNLKLRIAKELKISFEEYLKQVKKTEEEVTHDFSHIAEERIKGFLALRQIAKNEKIEIKDEEINEKIEVVINQYPDKEMARKNMDMEQAKIYIEDELKREKIFNLLGC